MKSFDVIVVGGGLAGLSIAAHLIETDSKLRVLVYDARQIGEGASGVPAGMVNPITGQRARIIWEAESCMKMLENRINKLSSHSETRLRFQNGVMRPAIDVNLGKNFRTALKKTRWPKGWIEWMTPEAVHKQIPQLKENSGAIFVKPGSVVRTPDYLDAYASFLKKQGVSFLFGGPYQFNKKKEWILDNGSDVMSAPVMVIATGYKARENKYWGELPLNSVKGQLAIYNCEQPVASLPAISAYGYVAPIDTHQLAVGSTYEHQFHTEDTDSEAAGLLDQKLKELVPELYSKCRRIGQWSGIRATTPDRLPILGEHYGYKGLYTLTGLGSKGLLYSECMGSHLAKHILKGTKIPKEISLYRFSRYRELRKLEKELNQPGA